MTNPTLKHLARAILGIALASSSMATLLTVDVRSTRGPGDRNAAIESAVRTFNWNVARLSDRERAVQSRAGNLPSILSVPVTVKLEGVHSRDTTTRGVGDISLVFDGSGSRSFPTNYTTFLQSVFTAAKPLMNTLFGAPFQGGVVHVRNYDADLGDRFAVGGGIYLDDNGSSEREIRFPIYQDTAGFKPEVTAVNFVHSLLLAYLGSNQIQSDGWMEGLVRAVTMRIVRTPGGLPVGMDSSQVEAVLASSYDIGPNYDWCNQRALGGPTFVPANLRSVALPVGGSIGGLYLLRYQMAGSAFQKVLVLYPTFAAEFLSRYYLNPSSYQNLAQVRALGQVALDSIGGTNSLIEDRSFSSWTTHQFVLDPSLIPGNKLVVQPFAITDGLSGSDFGVFAIQAHWFETRLNGDENLLRDTGYPIYWSPDFTRFFASAQDDRMDIVQAYGSVVPNFPGTSFGGAPYRVTVDVPVQDQIQRVYLPAGAIATAANPTPNDCYGTLVGASTAGGATYVVRVKRGSASVDFAVQNQAFGGNSGFDTASRLIFEVRKTVASVTTVVASRTVNKGPGSIGVVLDVSPKTDLTLSLGGGLNAIGFNLSPWMGSPTDVLSSTSTTTLASRWNSYKGRFEFYPEFGAFEIGGGYFARVPANRNVTVQGYAPTNTPIAVALRPGWNMICNPMTSAVNLADVLVATEANSPTTYSDAIGHSLGTDVFQFNPGSNDPISGVPETGTLTPLTLISPGQAVYVRCLSSTGATMLFPFVSSGSRAGGNPVQTWEYQLRLTRGQDRAELRIGANRFATPRYEDQFDSPIAPGPGGLRLTLTGGLFRDTRQWGPASTFDVTIDNLVVGQDYTLDISKLVGPAPKLWLFDNVIHRKVVIQDRGTYHFRATSAQRTLRINSEEIR